MSYSSNCSVAFIAKKLEKKSTTKKQENLKNGKVRFLCYKGEGRLMAECKKNLSS